MQLNFDASTVAPDTGFDTVPAGWYNVAIDDSELKPTKPKIGETQQGAYLQLRFNILDGQYAGRKLFTRLNVKNSNQQTVEIAYKQLSAICHAVGVMQVQDSQQLHGLPLKVKVKIRKGNDEYEDQNEIIAYRNVNEQVEMAGATPANPFQGGGAPQAPQFQQPAAPTFQQPAQTQAPMQQQAPVNPGAQPWAQPPGGFQQQAPVQQAPVQQQTSAPMADPNQQPWNGGAPVAQQPWDGQAAPVQQQQAPVQQAQTQAPMPAQQAAPPWAQPQS